MTTDDQGQAVSRQESEDRFKLLFNEVADALFLHDLEGRFVEVNQAACDSLGYTREELLQLPLPAIEKAMGPEGLLERSAQILRGEKFTVQGLHRRQDGTTFPVEVHLGPFEYAGRPHILASARDITDRLQSEEALRISESFLHSIIDQSPYPLWIADSRGTLIRLNQACQDLLHLTTSEVVGKYNVFQDNILEQQGLLPILQRVFEKGETVRFEIAYDTSLLKTIQLKTTTSVILDVTVSPIIDTKGRITNAVFQHVDITDQKRAAAALEFSQKKYRSFYESILDGFASVDRDGNIVEANQSYLEMIGYTAAEIQGLRYQDITPAKWHKFEADIIEQQVLTRGYSDTYEKEYIRKDGTVFPVELRAYLIKDKAGAAADMWAFVRDITARKQTEEALKKEELFTEAILDSLPGTFFLLDPQGRHLRTNTSGMVISGYSQEELSKMHALEFIADEDKPAAQRALEEVFEKGEASVEAQQLTKDGRKIPFLFTARKFIIDGMPFIIGTGVDITERKQAEEALRESEKQFRGERALLRALIDSIPDLIFFKDQDSVFLGCNRAFEIYSGMQEGELIGSTDLEIAPREVAEFYRQMDREMLASGKAQRNEEWIPFKNGGAGYFDTLKTPYYGPDGELLGLIGVSRDITARKEAEEALRESEKKYRTLFQEFQGILNAIPDILCLISPDLRIVWENEATGLCAPQSGLAGALGQHCHQLRYGRTEPCEDCPVIRCFHSGKLETEEKTAHGRFWELRAVPLYDDQGELLGAVEVARNITERKRMEEALRQSEARFRQVVESSPLPIGLATADGKIEYVNPQFVETFGYTLEDVHQLSDWFRLAYPDPAYRQSVLLQWQESLERFSLDNQLTESIEVEITCKDDSKRIMQIFGTPVGNNLLTVFIDLTERKRMEEVLEKRLVALSRPLDDAVDINFHDLFNLEDIQQIQDLFAKSTGVASLITAPDGTPITRPSNFCRLCGDFIRQTELGREKCSVSDAILGRYNPDAPTIQHCLSAGLCGAGASIIVGGKHIANWLIGQVRDETVNEEGLRDYARTVGVNAEEFIAAFREVPYMPADQFQQVAQALFVLANQLSAMAYQNVQQARFITERKHMEEALRDSERRLSELIDFLPDATFAIDLSGKVIAWNRAIEEMTGVPAESILGKGDYEYARHFYGVRRPILIDLALMSSEEMEKKYVFVQRQGDILLAEADVPLKGEKHLLWGKARPLYDSEGKIVGAIEAIRDISERQRAEEERARLEAQMREVQKLESLGVLAGGIAHDFNNLLMAILGNADLALLALSPASPARPNVEEIVRASQRAADLCRQMLAYSGKGRFVVGRYDLSEIVREMAQMLKVSVSKKAALRYSFATDLPAVEVDATQMRQVIMNLITNASEAVDAVGGVISVSTGIRDCDRAYLSESYLDDQLPEGRYVYLEVADTGYGMDEETRRRIFDPFFTTKFTGRGLGLAAVLGIVRGHRGAIKIYSEPGEGTTIKILLPAVAWEPGDLMRVAAPDAALRPGGTILLIDDDRNVCQVTSEMLTRLGFRVITAAQGREGLEILQARGDDIDCVILDLTMPEMGGEEVFREMHRLRKAVPVILSSGYNEQDATEQFAGQGLAGFIQKPYTVAKLQEILTRVLSQ